MQCLGSMFLFQTASGVRTDREVRKITARLESGLNVVISGTSDPYVGTVAMIMRLIGKNGILQFLRPDIF